MTLSPREEAKARAREIAKALHLLYGRPPSITWTEEGHLRVSLRLAEQPDGPLTDATLKVLDQGDRFGTVKKLTWLAIWSEVDVKMPEGKP
ncbi:hypothetical protein [Kitasatospora sp. P5_F3]